MTGHPEPSTPAPGAPPGRVWTVTVEIPAGRIMTSNSDHTAHWSVIHQHRQAAKTFTIYAALNAGIPRLARCRVDSIVHHNSWGRIDAHNLTGGSTMKGALDGFADEPCRGHRCPPRRPGERPGVHRSGIVASDRYEHMQVTMPRLAALGDGPPRIVFTITELPAFDPLLEQIASP